MANAGWYTMPDWSVEYPYGLKGTPATPENVGARLAQRLLVLLGTADVDPNHASLSRTPESMAQGPHRFARGLCACPEWALWGYHGRVLVSARVQELKSLPVRARRS